MFRKVVIPTTLKLSGLRTFGSLTRTAAARVQPNLSLFRNQTISSALLNQTKIAPYAFIRHETTAASKAEVLEIEEPEVLEPTKAKFSDIKAMNPDTRKAINRVFKYEDMSTVQEAVLARLPNKDDMFVKAKTGTGKTLAFLIAALETATAGKSPKDLKVSDGASILVISPTRELANQIADEAQKLVSFYPFRVHCLVGGDSKRRQIEKLERRRADIIVATPGRLNDMLSSVPRFKKICESLKVLVLDEADQLLDMGFKAELQRILEQVPEKRQTMLFSATISDDIRRNLGQFALSPDYKLIDTVGKDEVNTNLQVKQSALVAPYHKQLSIIKDTLETSEAANKGKVIVFLPTTKSTMVYANIFRELLPGRKIHEIHSKKNQDQRSRIADRFRKDRDNSILFTSDVSARGVDYPGVSLVLQVGAPSNREQYIHRLGRTGRAGREGEGLIVLAPFEKSFLERDIPDLPVEKLEAPEVDETKAADVTALALKSFNYMDEGIVREVYTAFLGYYGMRVNTLGMPRGLVLKEANKFLNGMGIDDIPHVSDRFLEMIGLGEKKRNTRDRQSSFGRFRNDKFDRNRGNNFSRSDSFSRRRNDDDFKPRRFDSEFEPRRRFDDEFKPRRRFDDNEFKPRRDNSDFKPRRHFDDNEFKPRRRFDNDDFKPRNSGWKSRRED